MNAVDATEFELRFQVPAAALPALRQAMGTVRAVRLHAVYCDTADGSLAAAGLVLRLRREGRRWVQTLKGRGDGLVQRPEHEVTLPPQRGSPVVDPGRHAGSAAGALLEQVLQGAALVPQYATDIHRSCCEISSGGARIELALDQGHIAGGTRRLPVRELEFELLEGPPQALLDLAAQWVQQHGLWLDVRTKSERGSALRRDAAAPVVRAEDLRYAVAADCAAVFGAALQSALRQCLPNAAALADDQANPEHLHQLRVGLRRLRSALRLLGGWSGDAAAAAALEADVKPLFAQLGAARDDDVVEAAFGAALRAAGAPELAPPGGGHVDVGPVLRQPTFSLLMLRALALALQPGRTGAAARAAGTTVLRAAWRAGLKNARGFAEAPLELQHRTRKRLKRLRYGAEFLLPLWSDTRAEKLQRLLRAALEALGDYNDVAIAQAHYTRRVASEPAAWFALGWLAAEQPRRLRRCSRALRRLARAKPFWR